MYKEIKRQPVSPSLPPQTVHIPQCMFPLHSIQTLTGAFSVFKTSLNDNNNKISSEVKLYH